MAGEVPIEVECSAGYKADETPRRFRMGGRWIEIREVLGRVRNGGAEPGAPVFEEFTVLDGGGRRHRLRHEHSRGAWTWLP